jgi:hypothetical protein
MSDELEIQVLAKSERFNDKKQELKDFSEKIPKQSNLPTVPKEDPFLGFMGMEYDVKGKDLNALSDAVQNRMIEQNKHIKKIIQEFNTIYETFQILDDEYIQNISKSLLAAKEANNIALQSLEETKSYQKSNENLLNDIFKQNKDIINILKDHHNKLEEIDQLEDRQSQTQIEIDNLNVNLNKLAKIENSFYDLQVQVEEKQSILKNEMDGVYRRVKEEKEHLNKCVEDFQIKLEKSQREISFFKNGFYILGLVVVIIVIFLLFKVV